jgi:hypothetical protein
MKTKRLEKKKHKKRIVLWQICFWVFLVIFFSAAICDLFNVPTKFNFLISFLPSKEIFYFLMASILSLSIFYTENDNADKHNIQLQNKINQIFPLTMNNEILEKVLYWMTSEKSNTQGIIFYFPYSLIPGFWVEPRLFQRLIEQFDYLNEKTDIKLLFIGPKETDYNFISILDSMKLSRGAITLNKDGVSNFIDSKFKDSPLGRYINISGINKITFVNDKAKLNHIRNVIKTKYVETVNRLKSEQSSRENNIQIYEIVSTDGSFWKCKPPFSIIIRCKKKDGGFDAILTDTFNIVKDFNVRKLSSSITNPTFMPDFSKVREDPNNYEFQNQDITNLFVNNLLLTLEPEIVEKIKNIMQ